MRSQRGSVALIAIVFLLFLTIIGVAWLPLLNTEAQHAKQDKDEQLAWYAAEAGYKRAYAALKNNLEGYGSWNWLATSKNDTTKQMRVQSGSDATYSVVVTNITDVDGNYKISDGKHTITSVGRANGVTRIITEDYFKDGSGGTVPENDYVVNSDADIVDMLLNATATTSNKDINTIIDYFGVSSRKVNGTTLDSLGGNFAQYFNNNFWKTLVSQLQISSNATNIKFLKKVDSINDAPRVVRDAKYGNLYDVTPEHYLWSVTYRSESDLSVSGMPNVDVYFTYIGDVLDNCWAYKTTMTGALSSKRPASGDYFVVLDWGMHYYRFLPNTTSNPDVSSTQSLYGNPVAGIISSFNNVNDGAPDDRTGIYIDKVYQMSYRDGSSTGVVDKLKTRILSTGDYTGDKPRPLQFRLDTENTEPSNGNYDFQADTDNYNDPTTTLSDKNGYPRTNTKMKAFLKDATNLSRITNINNASYESSYTWLKSRNNSMDIKYFKSTSNPSKWTKTTLKNYLVNVRGFADWEANDIVANYSN